MKFFTIFHLNLAGFAVASVEQTSRATSSKTTAKTSKPAGSHTSTASATAFNVTSCIPKLPTAISKSSFTITSKAPTPITAALYSPSAHAAKQIVLQVKNQSYFYSNPKKNAVKVLTHKKESLMLTSDGTFELIGANCKYGVRGKIQMNNTKRDVKPTRPDSALQQLDRRYAPYEVQISITMLDQCENPVIGADPHLVCNHTKVPGTFASFENEPIQDFTDDNGEGIYTGICSNPDTYYQVCSAGNDACTSLGNALVGAALGQACGGVVAALADIFTDGVALPATAAIQKYAGSLCGIALGYGLNKFCSYEGYGDNFQCPSPQVDLIMSMDPDKYIGKYFLTYDTTSTLATSVNTEILSISQTVTSLAPTCSATGPPLPSIQPITCPHGIKTPSLTYCEYCYNSPLPIGSGMQNYGIVCDICCGCCRFTYSPVASNTRACCEPGETEFPCPNQSTCANIPDPYTGTTCSQPSPEEYCAMISTSDGRHLLYETDCYGPDQYRLFNPSNTSSYTWCDYLGDPFG